MAIQQNVRQLRAADRYLRKHEVSKDVRQLMRDPGNAILTPFVESGFDYLSRVLITAPPEILETLEKQYKAALVRVLDALEGDFTMFWYFAYKLEPVERIRIAELLERVASNVRDVEARDDRWQTRKARRDTGVLGSKSVD